MTNRKPYLPAFIQKACILLLLITLSAGFLLPIQSSTASTGNQVELAQKRAQDMLARMSTQEKVGQLFLVTMDGMETAEGSQIRSLISTYHVGGVMLQRANDNFTNGYTTIQSAYDLISSLQQSEWEGSLVTSSEGVTSVYIPLLIGAAQEGDGAPYSQLLSGFTDIPNEMTLGAAWNTGLAEQNGQILGDELQKVGINLLIGPSLDVLELPGLEGGEDLGTRTFGGDPYWVGEMGKAFIKGIHTGSESKVAVMAKHFPGRGGSDRPTEEDVATVRKSLEQLKQIELAPFFAITSMSDPLAVTDGLLVSHIRYQGFQGNIRVTTRPVSFDSTALSQILSLPEFTGWRDAGGIILSEDLGSSAVRKFIDPTLLNFDARQTARNALQAGNDILYVDNFTASGDPDSYTSIVRTLDYFTQKYDEDPTFAQRVDASVLRILALKYELYPSFNLSAIIPPTDELNEIGKPSQIILDTAQSAAALINPSHAELPNVLPDPPDYTDRIVFLMDSSEYQQCASCTKQVDLASDSLRNAVLRLYGSAASGQVNQQRLSAFSFEDLSQFLAGTAVDGTLEAEIKKANWVVVSLQKLDSTRPASSAFRQLLAERPEILRNKKVVVFAFNAPYYLDATDISNITAYYALYSKSQPFIDLAARILFQEVSPRSAPPVSIVGVGYDLITATSPDPAQVILLRLDLPETPATTPTADIVAGVATMPVYSMGDNIPLRTGVILDHNQHPVPNGTPVRFIIKTGADSSTTQQLEATTLGGIARAAYRISTNGFIEIRVVSEPAGTSEILQLDIPIGAGAGITAIAPTAIPSETPVPSETPLITPTITPYDAKDNSGQPTFWEWLLVMLIIGISASMVYSLGKRIHSMRWGIRWALCAIIGGVASYIYLTVGMPGGAAWLKLTGTTGMLVVVILCMCLGFAVGILWHAIHGRPGN